MEEAVQERKIGPFEKRIHEIDFVRGVLMCLVIMDHLFNLLMSYNRTWMGAEGLQPFKFFYDVFHFYWSWPYSWGPNIWGINMSLRMIVRYVALGGFCFLSGISSAFSRNNWKRAIEMIILWAIIFLGSNLLQLWYSNSNLNLGIETFRIDLNVIGVLAFSTLIYCFFQNKSWKVLAIVAAVGLALHITVQICRMVNPHFGENIYFPFLWKPSDWVAKQADYMPLVPYISFFFGGVILSRFTYSKNKVSYFKRHEWERPICFLGRHSLIVYASHFLLLMGIFALINLIVQACI